MTGGREWREPLPQSANTPEGWGGPGVSGCPWKVDLIRVPGKPAPLHPSLSFPFSRSEIEEVELVSYQGLGGKGGGSLVDGLKLGHVWRGRMLFSKDTYQLERYLELVRVISVSFSLF